MSARKWTESQQDAISARDGTLLVSAAAGSGKTAVLVQRVIERITDEHNPTDADRLLVVTFTKAAAAEMSSRIAAEISKLLEADPFNVRLQRQQILLTRAHISTIHSFCSEIIRENFYKLGISPDFRILEDTEMDLLRSDAITTVLDEYYTKNDPVFLDLVEAFASGRDDDRIIQTVNRLYDFVRSHPFPNRWLKEKAAMYSPSGTASQTVWGQTILDFAADAVDYCISLMENSLTLMQEDAAIAKAYSDGFSADLAGLQGLKAAVDAKDWDKIAFVSNSFSSARLKPLRGYDGDPLKNKLTASRKEMQATVKKIAALFSDSEEQCREDIARLQPLVQKLFEVTVRFGEELDRLKAERRAADYGDLEHWALKLLVKDTDSGFERTPEAEELSARFDEVMVDEYQDTNEAQDMIFQAISRSEQNLFMVGDVKQSIYRFRQAMPQIFLRRRADYPLYDREKKQYPACVVLDRNFRSRSGVTDAVNFVFHQLMSRQTGELDYTAEEELVPAAEYPEDSEPAARLDIIDLSVAEDDKDIITAESRHIAELIYEMIGTGKTVTQNGQQRPIAYRDICILLRSANKYAHEYARELTLLGIPAWADTSGGFFAAAEVGVMLSLLRVIDNPMQDIPLLAVLMSPIYGFTADDLSDIRVKNRNGSLYLAVTAWAQDNDRAAAFLKEMEEYRSLAATMPSDRLINLVYEKTGYINLVQAMPNGELRLANLRLLLEYAKKYEAAGYGGLSGFIRFIDRLQKNDSDLAAASSISEAADVVKIMSIHRSKGLEFPVCILAGCSRRFNKEHSDVLLHPELGLGVKLKDAETLCRYTTMPREAVALELDRGEMSEELRVLYVAMTRAKEKLIMVTAVKDAAKTLGSLASHLTDGERIPPYVVRSVSSISDWLLLCALRHPSGKKLRDMGGALPGITAQAKEAWSINIVYPPKESEALGEEKADVTAAQPNPELQAEIERNIDFIYPYAALQGIQAKVAASDLAAREFSEEYAATSRPAFLCKEGLTPAERGTALHAFLQFADYKKASVNPEEELKRLQEECYLTAEQANAVDLKHVRAFFASKIVRRILASNRVLREYRFTVEITAGTIRPELTGEMRNQPVVLQGAVDCAFEENGALVLVDYKTDRAANSKELLERYRAQLALYKLALEQCTDFRVSECLLYSFELDTEIILDN